MDRRPSTWLRSILWGVLLGTAANAFAASVHEIPNDVTVQALVKPEGNTLRVLLRVPLEAMRDIEWPTRGAGYLDLPRAGPLLDGAVELWLAGDMEFYEGSRRLPVSSIAATRVSLPSDRSFVSYETAVAHVTGPALDNGVEIYWQQSLLDVMLEYPITSDTSEFSVRPGLERLGLRVLTVLRFLPPDGGVRPYEFAGDPGRVRLDPRWHHAALRFVRLGFFHILDGIDHLLFLVCLVVPFRRWRPLVLVVTSFTVAHSITLLASAFGYAPDGLWFPALVETLIAASIVYMAIENVIGGHVERRWMISFGFGLVHGFGFSFALGEMLQFAGSHLAISLVAFNVGVEMGQVLVLAVLVPMLGLIRKAVDRRMGTIIVSVLVGHTAWHWMLDRGAALTEYSWPEPGAAAVASLLRWLIVLVSLAFGMWIVSGVLGSWANGEEREAPPPT